jgi:hypothetical protein
MEGVKKAEEFIKRNTFDQIDKERMINFIDLAEEIKFKEVVEE